MPLKQGNRILFSVFYVLSQKIKEICLPLLPIKLVIILRANGKEM